MIGSPTLCQPGYHYDFATQSCVPDQPVRGTPQPAQQMGQQQGQQQMDPMQMYDMYSKYKGMFGGTAPTTGLGPMAGGGGTSGAAGVHVGGSTGILAGPQVSSGAVGGGAGSAGGGGLSGLASFWPAALVAAIAGGVYESNHHNISSYKRSAMGKSPNDWLESDDFQKHAPLLAGQLKPWGDAHDPSAWKDIPKDSWKAFKAPWNILKGILT